MRFTAPTYTHTQSLHDGFQEMASEFQKRHRVTVRQAPNTESKAHAILIWKFQPCRSVLYYDFRSHYMFILKIRNVAAVSAAALQCLPCECIKLIHHVECAGIGSRALFFEGGREKLMQTYNYLPSLANLWRLSGMCSRVAHRRVAATLHILHAILPKFKMTICVQVYEV